MRDVKNDITSVWVIQPKIKNELSKRTVKASFGEAIALSKALPGIRIMGSTLVSIETLSPKEFFGSGKVDQLAEMFEVEKIDLVIINCQISPVQQRNLEKKWKVSKTPSYIILCSYSA